MGYRPVPAARGRPWPSKTRCPGSCTAEWLARKTRRTLGSECYPAKSQGSARIAAWPRRQCAASSRIVFERSKVGGELLGHLRVVLAPVVLAPEPAVHLEGPHAVVVEARPIVVPTLALVVGQLLLQVFFEQLLIDLVTPAFVEAEDEDVEVAPVLGHRGPVAVAEHGGSQRLFGGLGQRVPQDFGSGKQGHRQAAKLH
uniref:Uncharacterized protein n=1 Tax=Tanacetum cinerariifolium TaxID=118510 RepID=A0A699QEP1_TANCI|nr:hypothetical protein [Tanacetum cinerariifolium]